jgi:hypothetical protein
VQRVALSRATILPPILSSLVLETSVQEETAIYFFRTSATLDFDYDATQ